MRYDETDLHLRYDEARQLPPATLAWWLRSISRVIPIAEVDTILDLGCGTGRFLRGLCSHYDAAVIGIDTSAKMLGNARVASKREG